MTDSKQPTRLDKATQWALETALDIDRGAATQDVDAARQRNPGASSDTLARDLIARARWKGAGVGALTGLPANPWVAAPAAVADVALLMRINVSLAARIALLYEPNFLDDQEPPYELLVPIFGGRFASEVLREGAIRGGMGLTRAAIRKYLTKGALEWIKRVALRYLGLKVTQRMIITKVLPVVGGAIGGAWNYGEVHVVGSRTIGYFSGKEVAG